MGAERCVRIGSVPQHEAFTRSSLALLLITLKLSWSTVCLIMLLVAL